MEGYKVEGDKSSLPELVCKEVRMEGYKGFLPGLVCRDKQYAENTIYEESNCKLCVFGMHFCTNPIDVWQFYLPCNDDGELNDFAKVEALGEVSEGSTKCCTDKLKICEKMDILDFSQEAIKVLRQNIKYSRAKPDKVVYNIVPYGEAIVSSRQEVGAVLKEYSVAIAQECRSVAAATHLNSAACALDKHSVAVTTECCSISKSTGIYSVAVSSESATVAMDTGNFGIAANTGQNSVSATTGHQSMAVGTGCSSAAINRGEDGTAIQQGFRGKAISEGKRTLAIGVGEQSAAVVKEVNSIAIAAGLESCAMGVLGSWITLVEWDSKREYILNVKSHKVDGKEIKPDTYYTLRKGEFVECKKRWNAINGCESVYDAIGGSI